MFKIDKASSKDIDSIMEIINISLPLIPDPDWFVVDTKEYLLKHFREEGFTLKAMSDSSMAAFLTIRIPGTASDNMAPDYDFSKNEPDKTAHMETCVVHPDFRGNHLEARLFEEAEKILKEQGFIHLFGTVHPDNLPSLKSFKHQGFLLVEQKEKYGGFIRNVMYKKVIHL